MIIENYSDYLNDQATTTKTFADAHNSTKTDHNNVAYNESAHKISPSSMSTITENYNHDSGQLKLCPTDHQTESAPQIQQNNKFDIMDEEKIDKDFTQTTDLDNKQKKFRIAKEFNELLCLLDSILQTNNIDPRCPTCLDCKQCKELAITCSTNVEATMHREESILKECIKFDPIQGNFCVPLPLKDDPDVALGENAEQAKSFYRRVINKLSKSPEDKKAIIKSFNRQIELGFIQKLSDMPEELQRTINSKKKYVIPWNYVYKESSISTPVRIVINASSKTSTGKSLNHILCKGLPKINLLPLLMTLTADSVLLTLDLQKFYNSAKIPESHYHLQCVWWQENLDETVPPELFILKTHTYGVVSSGRVLELCLEKLAQANKNNLPFHRLFTKTVYVDDAFSNCRSELHAEELKRDCEKILPKYGFKAKGYAQSYIAPPKEISEDHDGLKSVGAIGMIWIPETDTLKIKTPTFNFEGKKHRGKSSGAPFVGSSFKELDDYVPKELTLRMVASQAASIWDPVGFSGPWNLGVKHILRMSLNSIASKSNDKWEKPLNSTLRDLWVFKFWEMIEMSKIRFPRCTFPLGINYTELIVIAMSDMGKIGKLQCFYSLKKISHENYHVQLIYSKNQLGDKRTVPCQELDSMNSASIVLDRICTSLEKVDRRAILVDSTPCIYWLSKDPVQLNAFHRLRVMSILRNCKKDDIFHIPTNFNSADIGTKNPIEIKHIKPGSMFFDGPEILKYGLEGCVERSLIKRSKDVLVDPAVKAATSDGFTHPYEPKLFEPPDMATDTLVEDFNKNLSSENNLASKDNNNIELMLEDVITNPNEFIGSFNEIRLNQNDEDEICSIIDDGKGEKEFIGAFEQAHRMHKIEVLREAQFSAALDESFGQGFPEIPTKTNCEDPTSKKSRSFDNEVYASTDDATIDSTTSGTLPQLSPDQGVQFGMMNNTIKEENEDTQNQTTTYQHSNDQSIIKDDPYDSQDPDRFILAVGKEFKNKVKERFEFHEYLINPLEKPWSHTIRVLSIALNFIRRIIVKKIEKNAISSTTNTLTDWQSIHQRIFCAAYEPALQDCFTNLCFIIDDKTSSSRKNDRIILAQTRSAVKSKLLNIKEPNLISGTKPVYSDLYRNIQELKISKYSAILYFLRLASKELNKFYPKSILRKHTFLMRGLYFSKQRILECDNVEDLMESEISSHELGISNLLPCTDRFSPVGIAILMHIHRKIAEHLGVDRSWSIALSSIYVFQGQSLLKDIVRSCYHCRYKLRKKFNTSYGPINKMSLSFAPVNEHVMLDLSGPYTVKCRLGVRSTRSGVNTTKIYLLHTVCLTSYLHTIAIVEDYSAQGFTDALHRISSRYGYPTIAYTDGSSSQLKSLLSIELTMSSSTGSIFKETGIEIRVSGTGSESHSRQGRVERAIALFQRFIEGRKTAIQELTILQFDSIICQATAFLNSMPLCHKKRIGTSSSSYLISPYTFLLGRRSNTRAPAGCPLLPSSRGAILDGIQKASKGMLKYFTAAIPDLLLRPTNHKEPDKIMRGDVVLFPYEESTLAVTYKLALVTRLEFDSDEIPRIAELSYSNSQELELPLTKSDKLGQKNSYRITRKGIHTLIKIYSADDTDINTDIDFLNAELKYDNPFPPTSLEKPHQDHDNLDEGIINKNSEGNKQESKPNNKRNKQPDVFDPLVPNMPEPLRIAQLGYLARP